MLKARKADVADAAVLYDAMFGKDEHEHAAAALAVSQPFIAARDLIESQRKEVERAMLIDTRTLPVVAWVESIRGFGLGNLGAIVGECGDLSNYATPAKLWKRLGIGVVNGGRQRKVKGAEALLHGYCASRRSVMWNVGQCIFRAQAEKVDEESGEVLRAAGPYRVVYDEYKAKQIPICEALAPTMGANYSPKAHAHNRSTRYMEKRVVLHLWREWRRATGGSLDHEKPATQTALA